jgi:alkylresorcinol/alkylpyrone synthase
MASFPALLGTARALPRNFVDQETLLAAFRKLWANEHFNLERLEQLHRSVRVGGRHLALPIEQYEGLESFAARNAAWITAAVDIGEGALRGALDAAGLKADELDQIAFVTVTGIATPSVDARLVERVGLRRDIKRVPIFGLGCVAGAAGLARCADLVRGFENGTCALLSVELCSLTLQREDVSVANIIASGLFGDGAACVIVGGPKRSRPGFPRIVATRSVFYPGTERVMGWDVVDSGFKVVLSAAVPAVVREHIAGDVDAFLGDHGLRRADVKHFIAHTGGPKVLEAFEDSLQLPAGALRRSWESLRRVGNLSSASVLFVLDELLRSGEPRQGDVGLLLAMGPGFCSELVLLRW